MMFAISSTTCMELAQRKRRERSSPAAGSGDGPALAPITISPSNAIRRRKRCLERHAPAERRAEDDEFLRSRLKHLLDAGIEPVAIGDDRLQADDILEALGQFRIKPLIAAQGGYHDECLHSQSPDPSAPLAGIGEAS